MLELLSGGFFDIRTGKVLEEFDFEPVAGLNPRWLLGGEQSRFDPLISVTLKQVEDKGQLGWIVVLSSRTNVENKLTL